MDPVGTTQAVLSAINYLWTAAERVKENREECKRLCTHARSTVALIEEHAGTMSPALRGRLEAFERSVRIYYAIRAPSHSRLIVPMQAAARHCIYHTGAIRGQGGEANNMAKQHLWKNTAGV